MESKNKNFFISKVVKIMIFSRKTFVKGKKALLKEASRDYWDIVSVDFEVRELGKEWMWE